jgi:5-methylcytosine-specific restriction endonuclease McrA
MFDYFRKKLRYAVRSPKWKSVRQQHLKENNKCAACGKTKDLEVHHKIPVHIKPELELDPDNLITLCSNSCHLLFGHLMDFKSWNPDVANDTKNMATKISRRPY